MEKIDVKKIFERSTFEGLEVLTGRVNEIVNHCNAQILHNRRNESLINSHEQRMRAFEERLDDIQRKRVTFLPPPDRSEFSCEWAIISLKKGLKVCRQGWSCESYLLIENGIRLYIQCVNEKCLLKEEYRLDGEDMLANDWCIWSPQQKD